MLKEWMLTGLRTMLLAQPATAIVLFVASYSRQIVSLRLTVPGGEHSSEARLEAVSTSDGCGVNPSWLTLDHTKSNLYCLDEGWKGNGSVSAFRVKPDGVLDLLDRLPLVTGPVSSTIYGDGAALAIAQYEGHSISTVSIADPSALRLLRTERLTLARPGPHERQEAPHPHQTILDPTGRFILVADLGADLVRVFGIEPAGENEVGLKALEPILARPGSGPRHAIFLVAGKRTFLYLLSELSNTVTGYEVSYKPDSTLGSDELFSHSTHGPGASVPDGATGAKIRISPDNKFLALSSRNESSFSIPNFDRRNSTRIVSDTLVSYSVDHTTGRLRLMQIKPSGGRIPRHFSFNKAGTLLAVVSQMDGRIVLLERDADTGSLTRFVASATLPGQAPSAVVFDE